MNSPRLFANPILERLTHIHPLTPALTWIPVILALLARAIWMDGIPLGQIFTVGALSVVTWTLVEYLLHRFVFHFSARGRRGKRLTYLMHGVHHQAPDDPSRLLMPPLLSFTLALLFGALFVGLMGRAYGSVFFAFFALGYLIYDYTHYATHYVRPRTAWGRWVKKSHMMHHYVSDTIRYGVSSPLWDFVFATHEEQRRGIDRTPRPQDSL